jgi:hypothetical protein
MPREFVHFSIIGTQKGGTTSLDRYLSQHPQICTAPQKEVHFFDLQFQLGRDWYEAQFPIDLANPFEVNQIVGEATPYYLFHPGVPERMATLYPQIKLIVMLRDPVDRAISHYHHAVKYGFESLSLENAIATEADRLAGETIRLLTNPIATSYSHQHHSYLARSRYLDQIRCWEQFFPRSQFLYINSADFFAHPDRELQRVCSFLGVDAFSLPDYPRHNSGGGNDLVIDPSLKAQLIDRFRPHNRALFAHLGLDFGWPT